MGSSFVAALLLTFLCVCLGGHSPLPKKSRLVIKLSPKTTHPGDALFRQATKLQQEQNTAQAHKLFKEAAEQHKHPSASSWMGHTILSTASTVEDTHHAVDLIKFAAQNGDGRAQHAVAVFHRFGLFGLDHDAAKATLYDTFSSFGGHTPSLLSLASSVSKTNCSLALSHLQSAAAQAVSTHPEWRDPLLETAPIVSQPALTFPTNDAVLQRMHEVFFDRDGFLDLMRLQASQGGTQAQLSLATVHLYGLRGQPQNISEARSMLEIATKNGDRQAAEMLGLLLLGKSLGEPNPRRAFDLLSTTKGMTVSGYYGLGLVHLTPNTPHHNFSEGIRLLGLAADIGHSGANYRLARHLISQHTTTHNDKITNYLTSAAQSRHTLASHLLAELHAKPSGIVQYNCHAALQHLVEVALRSTELTVQTANAVEDVWSSGLVVGPLFTFLDAFAQGKTLGGFSAAFLLHNFVAVMKTRPCELLFNTTVRLDAHLPYNDRVVQCQTHMLSLIAELYQKSAETGNTDALVQFGELCQHYPTACSSNTADETLGLHQATTLFQRAADARNPHGLFNAAISFGCGHGCTRRDPHLAKRYLDGLASHPRVPKMAVMVARSVVGVCAVIDNSSWTATDLLLVVSSLLFGLVVLVLVWRRL